MKFRLTQKCQNRLLTKFHVLNEAGDVVGSINVDNHDVPDLLRCWSGEADASPQSKPSSPINAMAAAFLQAKKKTSFSKAALLRGCLY